MLCLALFLTAVVVFLLVGNGLGRRWQARGLRLTEPLHCRTHLGPALLAGGFLATVLAHVVLHCQPGRLWDLPLWVDRIYRPAIHLTLLAFAGIITGAVSHLLVRQHHPLCHVLTGIGVTTVAALLTYAVVSGAPIHRQLTSRHFDDGWIRQSSPWSCAAASCANLAQVLSVDLDERTVAAALGTSIGGSPPSAIIDGMTTLGFTGHREFAIHLADLPPPCILLISVARRGIDDHAVLYLGRDKSLEGSPYVIIDPARGRRHYDADSLANIWGGRAILFDRTPWIRVPDHR